MPTRRGVPSSWKTGVAGFPQWNRGALGPSQYITPAGGPTIKINPIIPKRDGQVYTRVHDALRNAMSAMGESAIRHLAGLTAGWNPPKPQWYISRVAAGTDQRVEVRTNDPRYIGLDVGIKAHRILADQSGPANQRKRSMSRKVSYKGTEREISVDYRDSEATGRRLYVRGGYSAKTTPGSLVPTGTGGYSGEVGFPTEVQHPGVRARHFSEVAAEMVSRDMMGIVQTLNGKLETAHITGWPGPQPTGGRALAEWGKVSIGKGRSMMTFNIQDLAKARVFGGEHVSVTVGNAPAISWAQFDALYKKAYGVSPTHKKR